MPDDIQYVDTNTEDLVNSLIYACETFINRKLYPADPLRLFILWLADIMIQERVNINESAKQNIPRYAGGEYLDLLAEFLGGAERLPESPARTTLRFTLSGAQSSAQIIPEGARVTVDGDMTFETTESLTIAPGTLSGDATAVCQTPGTAGNGFAPGQVNQMVDIFPFVECAENITASEGGADQETDSALYERMRVSMGTQSTAGAASAYEYYAKTASALITDVKAISTAPGHADVRILLADGKLPEAELIQSVMDALSAADVRPLTDLVTVSPPDTVPYDIEFTYYMPEQGAASLDEMQQGVENAVETYKAWQSETMGRDINPSYLQYLLMQTGIKRVGIAKPVFAAVGETAVAVAGDMNIISGGFESW